MRSIAVMQPYFFPYIGYFQLIEAVDEFVFYDDVNYINRGWINRNKILINGEAKYITIPCTDASQNKLILEVKYSLSEREI
ncbi:MAG: WbqC family protein, partial [Balneolaceae bacterium]